MKVVLEFLSLLTPYKKKNETIDVSFLYLWVVNTGKKMRFVSFFFSVGVIYKCSRNMLFI
jgi:hypothetical protein